MNQPDKELSARLERYATNQNLYYTSYAKVERPAERTIKKLRIAIFLLLGVALSLAAMITRQFSQSVEITLGLWAIVLLVMIAYGLHRQCATLKQGAKEWRNQVNARMLYSVFELMRSQPDIEWEVKKEGRQDMVEVTVASNQKQGRKVYFQAYIALNLHLEMSVNRLSDIEEFRTWYCNAAQQGDPFAQRLLGTIYRLGLEAPQNDTEAARWYRLAAEQGNADAQADLAGMYENGHGVPQDFVQAYVWYSLAIAHGEVPDWGQRKRVEKLMTPAQIAQAQKLAREWKPKK